MRQILHDVEQNLHTLDIRSDEPDVVHAQLEHCLVSICPCSQSVSPHCIDQLFRNSIKLYRKSKLKWNMSFVLDVPLLIEDKLKNPMI